MIEAISNRVLVSPPGGYVTVDGDYITPETIDIANKALTGTKFDWRFTTPSSLRGHIVRDHMRPATLASYGVARFDIELAAHLGFNLDWVINKTHERLEETDAEIMLRMYSDLPHLQKGVAMRLYPYWDRVSYKAMLARNLIYIERLGLGNVNWTRVGMSTKGMRIDLNLHRDAHDNPFSPDRLI